MNVLLITPENRFIRAFRRGQFNNFAQLTMPYLAGFVRPPHSVHIIDEYNQEIDYAFPAGLVGITCNTPNSTHVYSIADRFRARGCPVVLGGPHVTLLPEEASRHADSIVLGEAEETWPALLADAANGRLEPVYSSNQPATLHKLPLPRRGLRHGRGIFASTVIATRGCPHRCSFCDLRQIYSPEPRYRPVEEVIAEIRTIRSPYFSFWDDQLFMSPAYALRLFRELEGCRKRWAAMVTAASTANERLVAAAARAGCVCLFLGLESFSTESLALSHKSFNQVEEYTESVERIHRAGISVQAGIVFGFDGDTPTIFGKTLRGAAEAGIDGATVSILTPFPKTPLYEQLRKEGRLLTDDWSYYNGKTAVAFRPAQMSPETLWNGYMEFRRDFYAPPAICRRIVHSRVKPLQSFLLNAGYRRALSNSIPGRPIPPSRDATQSIKTQAAHPAIKTVLDHERYGVHTLL
jgi:radical SAM superfamily enzyme YgiQ (UPF0313 family)